MAKFLPAAKTEAEMNSTKILVWTIVTMLVATVALPLSLTAQSTLGATSSPTVIAAMANAQEG